LCPPKTGVNALMVRPQFAPHRAPTRDAPTQFTVVGGERDKLVGWVEPPLDDDPKGDELERLIDDILR
jgi:hypothetical protein